MLIAGQNVNKINKLKIELSKSFATKDYGPAKQILSMRIFCDRKAKGPRGYGYPKKIMFKRCLRDSVWILRS